MGVSTGTDPSLRLLGLGNEILADDALGICVARAAERRFGTKLEVMTSSETGFNLLEKLLGASRLVVVDTIETGTAAPGTIFKLDEARMRPVPGGSPHFIGLFEVLAAARQLGLCVPDSGRVWIIAVEAADCATVGGPMHPAVAAAIPLAVEQIGRLLHEEMGCHG
jgi:hydrogenase maturation protease